MSLSEESFFILFGKTGVFYCGGPSLGKELSTLCHEFNQTGCSRFEFHKEQF